MTITSRQILSLSIGVALLIATAAAGFYWLVYKGPVELVDKGTKSFVGNLDGSLRVGKKVMDYLGKVTQFQPRLVIGEKTVIESNQQIAELAVTKKSFSQTYHWEHSFMGSTKRMAIKGDFVAKAGYVLKSPMELRIREDGGMVTMVLPGATILSNEMTHYETIEDKEGFWNRLSQDDREQAVNALKHSSDKFAAESGLLQEADDSMMAHLRKAVTEASEAPVEIKRETPKIP